MNDKQDILYILNALMWWVIVYTPIVLYVLYYTRNLCHEKKHNPRNK